MSLGPAVLDAARTREASKPDFEALLADKTKVLSMRDVKDAHVDWKAIDPVHNTYARFNLPISEAQIKNQLFPCKHVQSAISQTLSPELEPELLVSPTNLTASPSESSSTPATSVPSDDEGEASGQGESEGPDDKFLRRVLEDLDMIRTLKNNDGKVAGPFMLPGHDQLESVLSLEDQNTPDSWIPRSAELRRNTGKHPFNAEPDLANLHRAGMITPTKLHYVRNHAAVPRLAWQTHKLRLFADPPELLSNAQDWSMPELAEEGKFEIVEMPVTLACDGNRRKEVNMVKRSAGFNWTASGLSTAVWRGIFVRDLLKASGLADMPEGEQWHLHYEGADIPSEGLYGTSVPLSYVLDPKNDVMLAFGQNGRVLQPDHGFPIRSILPGLVGGRMVKWLSKMWVSKKPSNNFYHIYDNRVLPSFVTEKSSALAKAFFRHENTSCNEAALQSVICKPDHLELLRLKDSDGTEHLDDMYSVEGWAVSGAGQAIQRMELSVNGCKTWKYCSRKFVDKPLRHNEKHWAWIFWSCEVPVREFITAPEIVCRAWDSKKNTQPNEITWNITGMMNNALYRVRPEMTVDVATGTEAILFRHPVGPLADETGWMQPNPADVVEEAAPSVSNVKHKEFSLEEIAKHDKMDDCWMILDNKVYDVTSTLTWHPGGAESILMYGGKATVDVTTEYFAIHDQYAHDKRDECLIGVLSEEAKKTMQLDALRAASDLQALKESRVGMALQPDVFTQAKLVRRKEVSHDTRVLTFELPKKANGEPGTLDLPICRHFSVAVHLRNGALLRSYTPTRPVLPQDEDGTFDLLVKVYYPEMAQLTPAGGTISNYLDCVKIGEEIDIKGPSGHITYLGRGTFEILGRKRQFSQVNLVSGGSGITPHYQLIHAILSDPSDKTRISLVNANRSADDILLHDELNALAAAHPERFKMWSTLSQPLPQDNWTGPVGRVDETKLREHFFPIANETATFLCGPPGLLDLVATPALKSMGFETGKSIFAF